MVSRREAAFQEAVLRGLYPAKGVDYAPKGYESPTFTICLGISRKHRSYETQDATYE